MGAGSAATGRQLARIAKFVARGELSQCPVCIIYARVVAVCAARCLYLENRELY